MRLAKGRIFITIPLILALYLGHALANAKIEVTELNLAIELPNGYQVIPKKEWKLALNSGQQFIMKNPFDFDFLAQKKGSPFESSYFLVKAKKSRAISDDEFKNYVDKYYLNWESSIRRKQQEGQLSNLLSTKVIEPPKIDYHNKSVILKSSMSIGEITEVQYLYSFFNELGNLIIVFTPLSKADEADFDNLVDAMRKKYNKIDKPPKSTDSDQIISKKDTDHIFGLKKGEWEEYVNKMIHPRRWKVRLSPHETGTGVMSFDPTTSMGLSVQPIYRDNNSLPDMLIVGSYYPLGTLLNFTDDLKKKLERTASNEIGSTYNVSASYTKIPPFEGIELTVTKK